MSFEKLQEFVEGKLIKGLRRMAGLYSFNSMLIKSGDVEFYDTLNVLVSALRENKAKPVHYLQGLKGCGAGTEQKITKIFRKTINIISARLSYEQDP